MRKIVNDYLQREVQVGDEEQRDNVNEINFRIKICGLTSHLGVSFIEEKADC